MRQVKRKKAMTTAMIKVNVITTEATASNESQSSSASDVQIENVLICQLNQELNDDDIDKEYNDMKYTNELKKNDQNTELSRIAADFINNVIMTDKLR